MALSRGARSAELMSDVLVPDEELLSIYPEREKREKPVFLWVGRMMPRKGIELSLKAFARSNPDARLEIVGDGERLPRAKELAAELGIAEKTEFCGSLPRSQIGERMRSADVFLFTSLRDSVGVQLLEAMAAGLPIISLSCFGARDLVPNEGGFMVPVETSEQVLQGIASAISTLATEAGLREKMGRISHAEAKEHTMEKKVMRVEGFYSKIR
jgi:glycosyltransferase involved in cell wall biosynthesis